MLKEKRGQGLSITTLILIVLGVAVLIVLIVGFTMGWGKILPWISTNNVDTIAKACSTACATNSKYDFCTLERELKADEGRFVATCYVFSKLEKFNKYGIDQCFSISCDIPCTDFGYNGIKGEEKDSCEADSEKDVTEFVTVSDFNKRCCIKASS